MRRLVPKYDILNSQPSVWLQIVLKLYSGYFIIACFIGIPIYSESTNPLFKSRDPRPNHLPCLASKIYAWLHLSYWPLTTTLTKVKPVVFFSFPLAHSRLNKNGIAIVYYDILCYQAGWILEKAILR